MARFYQLGALAAALLLIGVGGLARAQSPAAGASEAAGPTLSAIKIKIRSGVIAGLTDGGVASWKAIPYAAPPVGPLRWRPPQKAAAWRGVRAADKLGALCEQDYNPTDNGVGPLPKSEDCLTLNVWAPARASRLPVMVWIHGGGFVNGSGTAALYDGRALARQGVVVVTLNYRLGRFGFFAHPALASGPDAETSGNYALMDILAALGWVRDNIARFGGDPKQVTIFGESAGGVAVNDLMTSPLARGLFGKAVVQSGLGREGAYTFSQAMAAGQAVTARAGLQNPTAQALRALPAEAILKWGGIDLMKGEGPMIDGVLLPMRPAEAFAAGREAPVPYLVGWNSLEFPAPAVIFEAKHATNPLYTPEMKQRLISAYPNAGAYADHAVSDFLFVEPAVNLARLHAKNGHPTYAYQFSIVSKAWPGSLKGAPHAVERGYVFKTLQTSGDVADANDLAQAEVMSAYWTSFAKTGAPAALGHPTWPRLERANERIVDFTNAGPRVGPLPRSEALEIMGGLQP